MSLISNLLAHCISIYSKVTTNVSGGQVASYVPLYKNIAALISPAKSHTMWIYQQRNISVTHVIWTDQILTGVKTGAYVAFGNRAFLIKGIRNILEGCFLFEIVALELPDNELIVEGASE